MHDREAGLQAFNSIFMTFLVLLLIRKYLAAVQTRTMLAKTTLGKRRMRRMTRLTMITDKVFLFGTFCNQNNPFFHGFRISFLLGDTKFH